MPAEAGTAVVGLGMVLKADFQADFMKFAAGYCNAAVLQCHLHFMLWRHRLHAQHAQTTERMAAQRSTAQCAAKQHDALQHKTDTACAGPQQTQQGKRW